MRDYNIAYKQYLDTKEVATLQDRYIQMLESTLGVCSETIENLRSNYNLNDSNSNYETFKISIGINFDNLMDKVCIVFGESKRDVIGTRRDREFVTPRHLFCYISKEYLPLATPKAIAAYLNRDRSTIYNNIEMASSLLLYDKDFREKYAQVKKAISEL